MVDWIKFYSTHPLTFGGSEYLRQVGHTINGEPISDDYFLSIIAHINKLLEVERDDAVLDICCGNGVITKEIAKGCRRVVGVDFSSPLIKTAQQDHTMENIAYYQMNALELDGAPKLFEPAFDKAMMYGALQHFETHHLEPLLRNIIALMHGDDWIIFLGHVPDANRKKVLYSSLQDKFRHYQRRLLNKEYMGTWWDPGFVESVCNRLGLAVEFHVMELPRSLKNYRFGMKITQR